MKKSTETTINKKTTKRFYKTSPPNLNLQAFIQFNLLLIFLVHQFSEKSRIRTWYILSWASLLRLFLWFCGVALRTSETSQKTFSENLLRQPSQKTSQKYVSSATCGFLAGNSNIVPTNVQKIVVGINISFIRLPLRFRGKS